jgi:hypothetical protein
MMDDIKTIPLVTTPDSGFVVFSDAHRGDGTGADDFAANSLIFKCALDYYLAEGFTLIELGDAEELWEIERFDQIYITHTSIYQRLAAFHDSDPQKTRYIKIWGNHDLYWQDNEAALRRLFPGISVYEAALLDGRILLWHGHQADPSCSGVWARVAKLGSRERQLRADLHHPHLRLRPAREIPRPRPGADALYQDLGIMRERAPIFLLHNLQRGCILSACGYQDILKIYSDAWQGSFRP